MGILYWNNNMWKREKCLSLEILDVQSKWVIILILFYCTYFFALIFLLKAFHSLSSSILRNEDKNDATTKQNIGQKATLFS